MSQKDNYEIVAKMPLGWMTLTELAGKLKLNRKTVYSLIDKMPLEDVKLWKAPGTRREMYIFSPTMIDTYQTLVTRKWHPNLENIRKILGERRDAQFEQESEELQKKLNSMGNIDPRIDPNIDLNARSIKEQKERVQLEREKLTLQVEQNKVVEMGIIKNLMSSLGVQVRQNIISVIPKIAPLIAGESDIRMIIATLTEELNAAMECLIDPEELVNHLKN